MDNQQRNQEEYYKGSLTVKARLAVIDDIRGKLSDPRKKLFGETCFGPWLGVKLTAHDPYLTHLILQTQIVQDPPVPNEMLFRIAGRVIRFRRQEFCLITGLRFGADATPIMAATTKENPPIRDRLFSNIKKSESVKISDLLEIFDGDRFGTIDDDDAIRICMIMLIDIGFLGRQPHQVVGDDILCLVEDLHAWNRFPWGSFIWSLTIPKLKSALQNRSKEPGMKYTLLGCVWALRIWIYEAFPFARNFAKKPSDEIPRGIAWQRKRQMSWEQCLQYLQVEQA